MRYLAALDGRMTLGRVCIPELYLFQDIVIVVCYAFLASKGSSADFIQGRV